MSTAAGGTINVLERMLSSNENWSQRVADLSPNYFPENAQSHQPPVRFPSGLVKYITVLFNFYSMFLEGTLDRLFRCQSS